MGEERLKQTAEPVWTRRDQVHVFYSGHSLSDGVPEAMAEIARSLGRTLDYDFQSIGYSLLRERSKGALAGDEFTGYRTGKNRDGEGLDVVGELAAPKSGSQYDALVVTERYDLPVIAAREQTATFLVDFAKRAWAGNPDADVYLYNVWLPHDPADPLPWVNYERAMRKMWECVASSANRMLGGKPRIRLMPGASALADLVGELWRGSVPGLTQLSPRDRVALLFRDEVHLSPIGTYFIALLHYAVLFGQTPHGASGIAGLDPETAAHFQGVATRTAVSYGRSVDAAVTRDMASCRAFAADEVPALYYGFRGGNNPLAQLTQKAKAAWRGRSYSRASDPDNPFHD